MNNLYKSNFNNIENRSSLPQQPPKKKPISFKTMKKNTICSLNEVEYFLNNFNKIAKCLKLYNILK